MHPILKSQVVSHPLEMDKKLSSQDNVPSRDSINNPKPSQKQVKQDHYWLSILHPSENRFSSLEIQTKKSERSIVPRKHPQLTSNIHMLKKVSNITLIRKLLTKTAPSSYNLKLVKKQASSPESYKKIVSQLEEKNTDYTYKPKQEKSCKVMHNP